MSVAHWASTYISMGLQVVPLAPNTKVCKDEGWLRLVFQPDDFRVNDNIGIRSVNGLVIIDEDCPEAVACADAFYPQTGAVYGRPSKQRSKRLYYSTFDKTLALKDIETGTTLLEIRSGHQDMAPPSIHPDGEVLEWDGDLAPPSPVETEALLRATRLVATCAVVSRYYNPPGARHDWCLALSGTLKSLGIVEDECLAILTYAAKWADDGKLLDRLTEVRSTYERSDTDAVAGTKKLKELVGDKFVSTLNKIWGSTSSTFIMDAKGEKVLANQINIGRALDKMGVSFSFDVFSQRMLMKTPIYTGLVDDARIMSTWFQIERDYHFRPSKEYYFDFVADLARKNEFHPVIDYLKSLTWDGKPRVDSWLIRAAKAAEHPYTRAVSALVLIAAVRRVMRPGAKFDEMMVLESGAQGLMKSTALRALCPSEEWFSDDLPLNVDAKQIVERTLGKWIIEASDLSGMRPASIEHLKGMLSRQVDGPVRLAYARTAVEQPRQFVIIGTTNSHKYLTDSTGNRRFWPVRVEQFNVTLIHDERDQLWAEAYARERNGESIRLDPGMYAFAEFQQERRLVEDPWQEAIAEAFPEEYQRLAPQEIWEVLGIPRERLDTNIGRRVATVMQGLGYKSMTVKKDGKVSRGWGRGVRLLDGVADSGSEES
ncbi:Virulence-associated E [uncultured Caudovirales phage]|uniref:Virulence-associated E n=1 Tax=uncultured Caudovirales phage TaxID=2100421 RepID=A0A6J5R023_9CAUD|nr:Virulence-associated E [uncultured Caudovirales phage]